jgi:Tfp pilus assembly protein PilZ
MDKLETVTEEQKKIIKNALLLDLELRMLLYQSYTNFVPNGGIFVRISVE